MLPQGFEQFWAQSQQYSPMAGSSPFTRPNPFQGVPGLGSFPGMLAAPFATQWMAGMGMTPFGLGSDQNVYDAMLNQRYSQMRMEAERMMHAQERNSFMRTQRGFAQAAGQTWTADRAQAAGTAADAMASMMPMAMDLLPTWMLDDMHGSRGSPTLMLRRIMDATRTRDDPTTGRMGLGSASAATVANTIYSNFYSQPTGGGPAPFNSRGFQAGALGEAFGEFERRGMIGGAGMSAEGLGQRASQVIGRYTSALAAVRDIFGDNGRPNAPMAELFNALEKLSGGAMHQYSPDRLRDMVQRTHSLSQFAGLSMNAVSALQSHGMNQGAAMGLNPFYAIEATQGAMAFRSGVVGAGMAPAWGSMNADQLMQADQTLRLRAAASPNANRLNALLRMEATGQIHTGSSAAAMLSAMHAGNTNFVDPTTGRSRSMLMRDREFTEMITGSSDLGAGSVQRMLGQTAENAVFGQNAPVTDINRRLQVQEMTSRSLASPISTALRANLRQFGISSQQLRRLTSAVVNRSADIGDEEFADVAGGGRARALGEIVRSELGNDFFGGMGASQRDALLRQIGSDVSGGVEQSLGRSGKTWIDQRRLHQNPVAMNIAGNRQRQAQVEGLMRTSMAGLRPGSMIRNIVDALQNTDIGNNGGVQGLIAGALGGVNNRAIQEALGPELSQLHGILQDENRDPRQIAAAMERITAIAETHNLNQGGQQPNNPLMPQQGQRQPGDPHTLGGRGPGTSGATGRQLLMEYARDKDAARSEGGAMDEANFRKTHGLEDNATWQRFRRAAEMDYDYRRRNPKPQGYTSQADKDFEGQVAEAMYNEDGGGAGGGGTMTITGTVTLIRNTDGSEQITFNQAQGRNDVVPTR